MKVDRTKLKKTPTEAVRGVGGVRTLREGGEARGGTVSDTVCPCPQPADCRALIEKLKACGDEQLLAELQQIKTWNIGKVRKRGVGGLPNIRRDPKMSGGSPKFKSGHRIVPRLLG